MEALLRLIMKEGGKEITSKEISPSPSCLNWLSNTCLKWLILPVAESATSNHIWRMWSRDRSRHCPTPARDMSHCETCSRGGNMTCTAERTAPRTASVLQRARGRWLCWRWTGRRAGRWSSSLERRSRKVGTPEGGIISMQINSKPY